MLISRRGGALTVACLTLCLAPAGAGARGSCASRPSKPRLVHHVAPPQGFLSSLSVFRRPQTPADLQGFDAKWFVGTIDVPDTESRFLGAPTVIDADYIRKLGFAGGKPVYLFPARVQLVTPMSRRCLRRLSLAGRRSRLKLERADRARGVVPVFADIFGFAITFTHSALLDEGPLVGEGSPTFSLYGIVPDGVASVALLFESNAETTVAVPANFFSIEVPQSLRHGQATLIWRDASGSTMKSFPKLPLDVPVPPSFPEVPLF